MRPRHKAAEYLDVTADCGGVRCASMRPRHKAAEYPRENWMIVTSPLLLQ